GAGGEGAEVRLRHVEELGAELVISQNQYWGRHRSEVEDEPVASLDDLEWADGVAFGTPTPTDGYCTTTCGEARGTTLMRNGRVFRIANAVSLLRVHARARIADSA